MKKITFEERSVDTREARTVKIFCLEDIESHFNVALTCIRRQLLVVADFFAGGRAEEGAEILRSQAVSEA